ncbi:MAG: hypothetical protein NC345_13940 [Lachnospira sp.]|nr:hypothetical protein [Lachnospira sp.]
MKVINANEGPKIPYDVKKNKITFDDEIMLNLEKKEADADVHIDISTDDFGGLITGIGRDYVAQIDIPARRYEEIPAEADGAEEAPVGDDSGENDGGMGASGARIEHIPIPFSMDNVTLTLFALREGVVDNG